MKYIAFRIDDTTIKGQKVVNGFFVRGQKSRDYNWTLLAEFSNIKDAKAYIKKERIGIYSQPVYGPDGYGIDI